MSMHNIRDYKAKLRDDSQGLGSVSPFTIVAEALTLGELFLAASNFAAVFPGFWVHHSYPLDVLIKAWICVRIGAINAFLSSDLWRVC